MLTLKEIQDFCELCDEQPLFHPTNYVNPQTPFGDILMEYAYFLEDSMAVYSHFLNAILRVYVNE